MNDIVTGIDQASSGIGQDQSERFLVFSLSGARYALPAGGVRESLWLPRLTALEETAPWVLGAFDLRGELVPLVSLEVCLGHPSPAAAPSDLAIVAEAGGQPLAIHARAVNSLSRPTRVLPIPDDARHPAHHLLDREITLDDGIARVIEPHRVRLRAINAQEVADLPDARLAAFERDLDAVQLQRLADRATRYSALSSADPSRQRHPYVYLRIGGEPLAIPAAECIELARIGALVPVPCTPPRILWFTALRGEVLTLVDVRGALGLETHGIWEPRQMVVVRFGGQPTGIAVDDAGRLTRGVPEPVEALPVALRRANARWLKGGIRIDGQLVPVVSPGAMLEFGGLLVGASTAVRGRENENDADLVHPWPGGETP